MLIAQYKGVGFPSREIRFVTRSQYSHSAFLFDAVTERACQKMLKAGADLGGIQHILAGSVVEAWMPEVRNVASISSQHQSGVNVDVFKLVDPLTLAEEMALITFLVPEMGTPYNLRDVIRFVTKRPGNLDNSWFCSELVYAGLQKVHRNILVSTPAWMVPPDWIPRSPLLTYAYTVKTC
jgi:uncharacterized protein YycO